MSIPLPPDRPLPGAERMLQQIVDSPAAGRRRGLPWLVIAAAVVLAALLIALPGLLGRGESPSLATPSASSHQVPTVSSPAPTPSVPEPGTSLIPGCLVERPAAWDALLEQYRMAAPPAGNASVAVLEVGLDGQVLTEDATEFGDERVLRYSTPDRGSSVEVTTAVAQAVLGDFDTDGTTFLFTRSVLGLVDSRWTWRPGEQPQLVDQPPDVGAPIDERYEFRHLQAQQNGYSIWLAVREGSELELVIRDDQSLNRLPLPGVTPQNVTGLAAQRGTVWISTAGGANQGYDLVSGQAVPLLAGLEAGAEPLTGLFSDGFRLGLLTAGSVTIALDDQGNQARLNLDTADTRGWTVSGDFVAWQQGSWPNVATRVWDTRTGAITELPAAQAKIVSSNGLYNGYLVVHDDPLRPAVLPLDALGTLASTC